MLEGVMLLWFLLTAAALLFVAVDIRTTPESPVLKWGFILLTAYTGVVARSSMCSAVASRCLARAKDAGDPVVIAARRRIIAADHLGGVSTATRPTCGSCWRLPSQGDYGPGLFRQSATGGS